MGCGEQAGVAGDVECVDEAPGCPEQLVVGQAERDDSLAGVALGDVGLGHSVGRVEGAVGGDHPADLDAGALGRGARGVEDELDQLLGRAEALAVVGQVDGRLDVDRAGGHGVVGRLVDEANHVGGPLQHVAGRHVHRGEDREAAEAADDGHLHPVLVGELGQRGRAHAAFEVDVEVGLGEGLQVVHGHASQEQGSGPRIGGDDGGQSGQTGEPVPRPGAYRERTTFSMLEMIP